MAKWVAKITGNPSQEIKLAFKQAGPVAMNKLSQWVATDLMKSLIYGGHGIQGISETEFYKFITSPEGLSQLGIPATEPPKLLKAYERAFKIKKQGDTLSFEFGDYAVLKMGTPHPAAGVGYLDVQSWLELIVDDKTIGRGFVPRSQLKGSAQSAIRLDAPLGGLMLPRGAFGSSGLWRFPQALANFEEKWLASNIGRIEDILIEKLVEFAAEALNG